MLLVQPAMSTLAQVARSEPFGAPSVFKDWPKFKPSMQAVNKIDDVIKGKLAAVQARFPNLCVSVLDITSRASPKYFGWNDDRWVVIGSAAKLAILYAAFQLRDDVRDVLRQGTNSTSIKTMVDLQSTFDAERKKSNVGALAAVGTKGPSLDRIFDPSVLGTGKWEHIDFLGIGPCGIPSVTEVANDAQWPTLNNLERIDEIKTDKLGKSVPEDHAVKWEEVLPLPFAQRLWMTIRWSDQVAATTCLDDLGLKYVEAVLKSAGLQDGNRNGLNCSLTFGRYPGFADPAKDRPDLGGAEVQTWPPDLKAKLAPYTEDQLYADLNHSATSRVLAGLMSNLVPATTPRPGRPAPRPPDTSPPPSLGSPFLRGEFSSLLRSLRLLPASPLARFDDYGTRSFIETAAYLYCDRLTESLSKLGILGDMICDCAFVEGLLRGGRPISLILVVLDCRPGTIASTTNTEDALSDCVTEILTALNTVKPQP